MGREGEEGRGEGGSYGVRERGRRCGWVGGWRGLEKAERGLFFFWVREGEGSLVGLEVLVGFKKFLGGWVQEFCEVLWVFGFFGLKGFMGFRGKSV